MVENPSGANPDWRSGRNLLGMANTDQPGRNDLDHIGDELREKVGGRHDIVIISYGAGNMDAAAERIRIALDRFGVKSTIPLHLQSPERAGRYIEDAQGFFITGGNTFGHVANLHADRHSNGELVDPRKTANTMPIVDTIRRRVADRVAIIGSSAGVMVMGDDIRTCTDSRSFVRVSQNGAQIRVDALDLLGQPISFHPHYEEAMDSDLQQYPDMDTSRKVLALPNGSYITVDDTRMTFFGETNGGLFQNAQDKTEIHPGEDLSHLLNS